MRDPQGKKRLGWRVGFAILLGLIVGGGGCVSIDPLTKHKLLTTVFDGVPELPTIDELCQDNIEELFNQYYEKRIAQSTMGDTEEEKGVSSDQATSEHRPWKEKNCQGCHDFKAKNKLRLPNDEICFLCHKNFIQGQFVHGPVAVGACLACHDPHSSGHPSLLQKSLKEICFKCHKEKRLAQEMHEKIVASGMLCVDCHDPHSRDLRYFLK